MKITTGRFKGMTVVTAPTTRVDRLQPEVQRVLDALGFPEAYVTDESSVGDFDLTPERVAQALFDLQPLDMLVSTDLIADVAEKLRGAH